MGFVTSTANDILTSQFVTAKSTNSDGQTVTTTRKLYIGLSTTTPDFDTGENFTEPSADNGYVRKEYAMELTSDKQVQNTLIIFFDLSRNEGYGTVTHFGIFTSLTAETPYFVGALTSPVTIPADYVPIFDFGALKIGLDKEVLE